MNDLSKRSQLRRFSLAEIATTSALFLVLCVSPVQVSPVQGANPNTKEPKEGIKSLGANPHAQAKITQLYELFNTEEQACMKLKEQPNTSRLPFGKIANSYAELWKAARDARHLQLMGEAAGYDLQKKLNMLKHEYGEFSQYASHMRNQVIAKLTKAQPRRAKQLQQAMKTAQSGQLEQANSMLEAMGKDIEVDLFYLTKKQGEPFWDPIVKAIGVVDTQLEPKRKKKYYDATMTVAGRKRDAVKKLTAEADRLATEIAAAGTAKLGEQTGDAADAIDYLGKLWGAASAELVNHVAMDWAFSDRAGESPTSPISPEIEQAESVAVLGINKIIDAAAAKATTDQVSTLYSRILKSLSTIDRRSMGRISEKCQGSVDKLLAKNPAVAGQIQAYQQATTEAIRWRRLFAEKKQVAVTAGFHDVSTKLKEKCSVQHKKVHPMYQSRSGSGLIAPNALGNPAEWMVYDANELVGLDLMSPDVVGVSKEKGIGVTRHQNGHYCQVKLNMPIDKQIADLNAALLLDDAHGPLTLVAADAISAAENLDFTKMGGTVAGVHLTSFTSSFGSLPAVAHALVPLNEIPTPHSQSPPVQQTNWRLDIMPKWVRNPLFTLKVPTPVGK